MWISGDVTCLHCGFVSGAWSGLAGSPITYKHLEPRPAGVDRHADVVCRWCGGPVYLREAEHARLSYRVHRTSRRHRHLPLALAAIVSLPADVPTEDGDRR